MFARSSLLLLILILTLPMFLLPHTEITCVDGVDAALESLLYAGHQEDGAEKGVDLSFHEFSLIAKEHDQTIGGVLAYTIYGEVYVDNIWVDPKHRRKGVGRKLLAWIEQQYEGRGYNNINLVTSQFQAVEFYKKCGYEVEFVRENKQNPALTKTFFVKYFANKEQSKGVIND